MRYVRSSSILVAIFALAGTQALDARTEFPVVGSSGSSFTDECPAGQYLVGLNARQSTYVDQVQIICATIGADGAFGPELYYGPERGGRTGTPLESACNRGVVVAAELTMAASNRQMFNVELRCRYTRNSQSQKLSFTSGGGGGKSVGTQYRQECPDGEVATGIKGRGDDYVAALGLICEASTISFGSAPPPPPPSPPQQAQTPPERETPGSGNGSATGKIGQFDLPFESESSLGGKFDLKFQVAGMYRNPSRFHVTGTITNTDIGPEYNGTFDGTMPLNDTRTVTLNYEQPGAHAKGTVVFHFSADGETFTGDGMHMGATPFKWTGRRKR